MKLVQFSLERFRSFIDRSTVNFSDNTVILGPNNEGKTNFLRAIEISFSFLREVATDKYRFLNIDNELVCYDNEEFNNNKQNPTKNVHPESLYYWERDFPASLKDNQEENKDDSSIFVLSFKLTEEECTKLKDISSIFSNITVLSIKIVMGMNYAKFSITPCLLSVDRNIVKFTSFILDKIDICYVDAVRTANIATNIINGLFERNMDRIYRSQAFISAENELFSRFYQSQINDLSSTLDKDLNSFVPSFQAKTLTFYHSNRPLHDLQIQINDGSTTPISQKGAGVQSLITLSLIRDKQIINSHAENILFAIEEPEAHLHPKAIREVKALLLDIAKRNQLIITTHSPLFVDTTDPNKNIIIRTNTAKAASKIADIREVLGVTLSDNLMSAELVLIAEGAADENLLPYLLKIKSPLLKSAFDQGRVIVSSCGGTHNMDSYVRFIKSNLCRFHIVADNDTAGNDIIRSLIKDEVISNNYTILKANGLENSEIEDLINPKVYVESIKKAYNISSDITDDLLKCKSRWSLKIKLILEKKGKQINDDDIVFLKTIVSQSVKNWGNVDDPDNIILPYRNDSFNELVKCLEEKLNSKSTEE